jgi:hypothetical protein
MIQNADSPQSKRIATPKWAIENRELLHIPADGRPFAVTIRALSPSDGTMKLAWIDIANLLPKPGDIQRRIISSLPPNHSSVAIWVEAGPFRALLGADLEHTGREGEGWMAVLTSHRARQEPQSGLHEVSNGSPLIVVGPAALCYHLVKGRFDFWMIPIALVEITAPDLSRSRTCEVLELDLSRNGCQLNRSTQHYLIS